MLKRTATIAVKSLVAWQACNFLWGVVYAVHYQRQHGLGAKPTKQEIANAYFGIKV